MSEILHVVCPSCPAALVVVLGATSILPKPFKWTWPNGLREHGQTSAASGAAASSGATDADSG